MREHPFKLKDCDEGTQRFVRDLALPTTTGNSLTVHELLSAPYQVKVRRAKLKSDTKSCERNIHKRKEMPNCLLPTIDNAKWSDVSLYMQAEGLQLTPNTTITALMNGINQVKYMYARQNPNCCINKISASYIFDGIKLIAEADRYENGVLYNVLDFLKLSIAYIEDYSNCFANVNAYIFKKLGIPIKKQVVITKRDGTYVVMQNAKIEEWSDIKTESYIQHRVKYHKEPVRDEGCTYEERKNTVIKYLLEDASGNILHTSDDINEIEEVRHDINGWSVRRHKDRYAVFNIESKIVSYRYKDINKLKKWLSIKQNNVVKTRDTIPVTCRYSCDVSYVCEKRKLKF